MTEKMINLEGEVKRVEYRKRREGEGEGGGIGSER
jgi:hypothetical protein